MAYSRFFDSHIYIYPHVAGYITCAGCWLNKDKSGLSIFPNSVNITNDDELIEHLEAHAQAGHSMPEGLLDEILRDPERYGILY